jgi:hypothetical protein
VPDQPLTATSEEPLEIDLKNRGWAAFLAWLWPGAGHLYQGRTGKGILFMVCILGTFFYGMHLGQGRVVYYQVRDDGGGGWRKLVKRLPYLAQVPAGLPALPALIRARTGGDPNEDLFHWKNWYAPPHNIYEEDDIHRRLNRGFELGWVYTVIAAFLNVLVIYDAWGGPAYAQEKKDEPGPKSDQPAPA